VREKKIRGTTFFALDWRKGGAKRENLLGPPGQEKAGQLAGKLEGDRRILTDHSNKKEGRTEKMEKQFSASG